MRAKSRWVFNVAEQVCFFGVKKPPTSVVCIFCRRGFSRERVISYEVRDAGCELNRGGCLMSLNRFAFRR